tara:strand:+ start:225 stop:917 length:693 start_codon:yes stop_codon:yes gene_type:complete
MAEAEAQAVEEQQVEETTEYQEEEAVEEQEQTNPNEDEVRKWQSMYDKAQADNIKLQNAMTDYLNSQKQAQEQQASNNIPQVSEDEFNPWDAYYKPDSPSYRMRIQSEQNSIHSVLDTEIKRIENKMALNNTRDKLRNEHNMNEADVNEFMNFISQPKESVPVESLVKLWKESTGKSNVQNVKVPQTKQPAPRTAGVLQGQQPKVKSEGEKMWNSIMGAGGRSNVLKQTK